MNAAIFIATKSQSMQHLSTFAKHALLLLTALLSINAIAQTELHVDGRALKKPNGTSIILRGVNSGLAEDGNYDLSDLNACKTYIDQIAMSGANTIRFTWYTDGVSWRDGGAGIYDKGNGTVMGNYIANGHLSNIFSYCKTKGIIPVLAIHDLTCSNDWSYFSADLKNWWTSTKVVSLINAHKEHIVINIANEMGTVRWNGGGPYADMFKANYNTMVAAIRTAGLKVPIMIDAPDCGQSISELMAMSTDMLNADPEHNIIFSTHLYWGGYATTQQAIADKFTEAVNANVCLVLGEVAPNQDNGACGNMDITAIYQSALTQACPLNIGWFAWSWDQDCSPTRNMTTNGNYNTLTTWGGDVVNNATYGLKNATCGASPIMTSIAEVDAINNDFMQWSGTIGTAIFKQNGSYKLYNLQGQLIQQDRVEANTVRSFNTIPAGIYVLRFIDMNNVQQTVKVAK